MDARDWAVTRSRVETRISRDRRIMYVACEDDDGVEYEAALPIRWEACSLCGGRGTHVHPGIDAHGITADEWADWAPEEVEEYMSGAYDVACYECGGERVVPVVDEAALTEAQRREYERYVERERDLALMDREMAAERAMGA